MIVAALERNPLFITAALPLRVFPPSIQPLRRRRNFRRASGQFHPADSRHAASASAPIFPRRYFSARRKTTTAASWSIDDIYGAHAVKLNAGDMVVYPASSLHHVKPVTRGVRLASFFWVQSMVRDDGTRTLLFDLDMAINKVNQALPNHGAVVELTNCYHNLLRRFAEV